MPKFPESLSQIEDALARMNVGHEAFQVKNIISVDLDGDGRVETIITATNIKQSELDALVNGKTVQGRKWRSFIVISRGKDRPLQIIKECSNKMYDYEMPYVADLDGDGVLEVLIQGINYDAMPAEGFALVDVELLKISAKKVQKMVEVHTSPI